MKNQSNYQKKTFECYWFQIHPVTFKKWKLHKTIIIADDIEEARFRLDRHPSIVQKIIQK